MVGDGTDQRDDKNGKWIFRIRLMSEGSLAGGGTHPPGTGLSTPRTVMMSGCVVAQDIAWLGGKGMRTQKEQNCQVEDRKTQKGLGVWELCGF